jgi:hypothetical protein
MTDHLFLPFLKTTRTTLQHFSMLLFKFNTVDKLSTCMAQQSRIWIYVATIFGIKFLRRLLTTNHITSMSGLTVPATLVPLSLSWVPYLVFAGCHSKIFQSYICNKTQLHNQTLYICAEKSNKIKVTLLIFLRISY